VIFIYFVLFFMIGLPEAVRQEVTTVHVRTHRIEDSDSDSDDNSLYHTVNETTDSDQHSRPKEAVNKAYESSTDDSDEESDEDEDQEEHAENDRTTEQGAHGNDVAVVVSSEKVDQNVNHIV
jgi:hypothetical protein